MDQAQIPAPGNDLLFPVAVPGQPFPLWFMSPAPAEQTVRGLAQSRDQRHPQHSSSSFFFSSPPDSHQALPYKLQGLEDHWVQL